jgi:hypothetical protein
MKQTNLTKKDLLIVLACIVLLLANLAAIGPRGRRHAKQALCLSNLRKWGVIFQQFAADNDGFFMPGWYYYEEYNEFWMDALRPYYANNHYLRCCPEATIPGSETGERSYIGGTFKAWGVFIGAWFPTSDDYGSYGMNSWICNPLPGDYYGLHNFWRTVNVAGTNNIPIFLDSMWIEGWPEHYDEPPVYEDLFPYESNMARFCLNRHEGFVNSAFLDFSARKVGLKELWKLKWHRNYNTCGPWTKCGGVPPDVWPPWLRDFKDY